MESRIVQPPVRLLAIGDIAWDVVVCLTGEPVWASDVFGTTDLLPGGSSANVAVWARRLGARVQLVGKIGDDRLGVLMRQHLAAEGLVSGLRVVPGGSTTRVTILVRPDGEHAFVTDHTRPLRLSSADLSSTLLDDVDVVFLNGYAVFMAEQAGFATSFLGEARRRGLPVVFDPSSFVLVRHYGAARLLDELGPLDVIAGNEEELGALAEERGIESLLDRARIVVVKQGPRGATALQRRRRALGGIERHTSAGVPVTVVDTTGAGDAFDATFLVEYYAHRGIERALQAANKVGSRVAGCLGAQTNSPQA